MNYSCLPGYRAENGASLQHPLSSRYLWLERQVYSGYPPIRNSLIGRVKI